ncbi:MAG: DUF1653 domain-containing protein [Clostridia bacterium]|nr:DUF1653 domain-containing protein [Clostridia bacterium]
MKNTEITPHSLWRHYKGNRYEVLALAKHSETLEDLVVYRALYGEGTVWVRPRSMWLETVITSEGEVSRFTLEENKEGEK